MISAEEQQTLEGPSNFSHYIKELMAITRDQFRQQDEAGEKAGGQLVSMAGKL